jgi:AbrB family looped-hinge helix DNA binding protein
MRTTVRLIESGRITIPAQVRAELGVEPGDLVEIDVHSVGEANADD